MAFGKLVKGFVVISSIVSLLAFTKDLLAVILSVPLAILLQKVVLGRREGDPRFRDSVCGGTRSLRKQPRNGHAAASLGQFVEKVRKLRVREVTGLEELRSESKYYLPFKDAPCLIKFDKLSVACLGVLVVSKLGKFWGDLSGLLLAAARLRVGFTYALVCSTKTSSAEPVWKVSTLLMVADRQRVLRFDASKAKEVIGSFIEKLRAVESVVLASLGEVKVEVLLGEEILKALKMIEEGSC